MAKLIPAKEASKLSSYRRALLAVQQKSQLDNLISASVDRAIQRGKNSAVIKLNEDDFLTETLNQAPDRLKQLGYEVSIEYWGSIKVIVLSW